METQGAWVMVVLFALVITYVVADVNARGGRR